MSVSLEQDDQVIRLLDNRSIDKHKKDGYNFIHFGMIQVAAKPLTRLGLNTAIVMCLRDNRHLEYRDSIIGAVQMISRCSFGTSYSLSNGGKIVLFK